MSNKNTQPEAKVEHAPFTLTNVTYRGKQLWWIADTTTGAKITSGTVMLRQIFERLRNDYNVNPQDVQDSDGGRFDDGVFTKKGLYDYRPAEDAPDPATVTATPESADAGGHAAVQALAANPLPKYSSKDKFEYLKTATRLVATKMMPSMIVAGEPSGGKTHNVMETLFDLDFEEGVDYLKFSGHMTPLELYGVLFENSDGLIIFDDCDSVMFDDVSRNILKAALDSYAVRVITYKSASNILEKRGWPSDFRFNGQVIFITNQPNNKIDRALIDRSQLINVFMTIDEKLQYMRENLHSFCSINSHNSEGRDGVDVIESITPHQLFKSGKREGQVRLKGVEEVHRVCNICVDSFNHLVEIAHEERWANPNNRLLQRIIRLRSIYGDADWKSLATYLTIQ